MRKNIICLMAALVAIFLFFELSLHLFHYRPWIRSKPGKLQRTKVNHFDTWFEPHDQFGWVYNRKKSFPGSSGTSTEVLYQGNELGFRDSEWSSVPDMSDDSIRVMVFGDSHTAGHGVHEEERYTELLQSRLDSKCRVYNFGVAGWGFDQMYLAFKTYVQAFRPRVAIFCYIHNDFIRSLESYRPPEEVTKPSFDLEHGTLKLRTHSSGDTVFDYLLKHLYSFNFFYKTLYKPYLAKHLNLKIADEIFRICRERNIRVVFVRIPPRETVDPVHQFGDRIERTSRWLYRWVYGLGIFFERDADAFIDLTKAFRDKVLESRIELYFPDGHINLEGHKLIAEILLIEIGKLVS